MGNGIALASVCASMGYPCVLVMPQSVSSTKQMMMRRLGAKVVLTEATEGMVGAVSQAQCCLLVPPKGYISFLHFQAKVSFLHLTNICQRCPKWHPRLILSLAGKKSSPALVTQTSPLVEWGKWPAPTCSYLKPCPRAEGSRSDQGGVRVSKIN